MQGNVFRVKVVLVGDSYVGKSNLISRFVEGQFSHSLRSTIGIEISRKTLHFGERSLEVSVWDTAGQEKYRSLTVNFYRRAMGALLVFDLCNQASLQHLIDYWYPELVNYAPDATCLIVGNKCDEQARQVPVQLATHFADKLGLPYIETSALRDFGVVHAFDTLLSQIVRSLLKPTTLPEPQDSLDLNQQDRKHRCCP
ncbi:hypothetical protein Ciccas_013434 [Cichlidogyrus casuarinus]|uniref:Uncharacterized protein n=1 Tax=Cichlidogyrus casuarinus TaxID=1844966 RepID=A0ABD2PKM9_9PLAT